MSFVSINSRTDITLPKLFCGRIFGLLWNPCFGLRRGSYERVIYIVGASPATRRLCECVWIRVCVWVSQYNKPYETCKIQTFRQIRKLESPESCIYNSKAESSIPETRSRVARTPSNGHEARLEAYKCCKLNGPVPIIRKACCCCETLPIVPAGHAKLRPITASWPPTEWAIGRRTLTLRVTASLATCARRRRLRSQVRFV